jgi:hypothetical protein
MKVLISLISEQQIPNVLFIKQIEPDYNIFVTTEQMEKIKQSDKIINTLRLDNDNVTKIIVDSENIKEIIKKCKDEIEKINNKIKELGLNGEFILNITGGTKIMALAAYELAKEFNIKTYYLPRQSTKFIKIYPKAGNSNEDIKLELSDFTVKEYLNSYIFQKIGGLEITFSKPSYNFDKAKLMFKKKDSLKGDVYEKLRQYGRNKDLKEMNDDIKNFLDNIEFEYKDKDKIFKEESRYITGGWFEEYVYYFIKEKCGINEIHIGIKIPKGEQSVENEFDIMFLSGINLHIIECKTSLKYNIPKDHSNETVYNSAGDHSSSDNKQDKKNIFSETVYKSAALLRNMGLTAKTAIVTLENLSDKNGEIRRDYKDRAEYFRIKIIDGPKVLDENKFKEEIEKFIK